MNFYKLLFLISLAIGTTACEKRETMSGLDIPSEENLASWHDDLSQKIASAEQQLPSNDTFPSAMSADVALTCALQELGKAQTIEGVPLNTIFTIKRMDDDIINGKAGYVGFCEFDSNKSNGATIARYDGLASCVVVVDYQNPNCDAKVLTENAKGEPYKMKVHMDKLTVGKKDPNQVFKLLDKAGYTNWATTSYEVGKPKSALDENLNPYYSVSWLGYDTFGTTIGTHYHPISYMRIDAQTAEIQGYALDNPATKNLDEGLVKNNPEAKEGWKNQKDIPTWVEWVYGRYLFIQQATHAYFPLENYAKFSVAGQLIPDGTTVTDNVTPKFENAIVDISQSRDKKDFIMMIYMTSRSNDLTMNKILTQNARTGEVIEFEGGIPVKSLWEDAITDKGIMRGEYESQDLTMHQFFGTKTWMGIIVRDTFDNEGNDRVKLDEEDGTIYSESAADYSIYAQTCFMNATVKVAYSEIICNENYDIAMEKYMNHLYLNSSDTSSNVLVDKTIKGTVKTRTSLGDDIIITLQEKKGNFIVTPSPYDENTEAVYGLVPGSNVFLKYGDKGGDTASYPVRFIKSMQ